VARRVHGKLSGTEVKSLVYGATLDEKQAEDAQLKYLMEVLKTGATPDV